jgi:hypothetical protein
MFVLDLAFTTRISSENYFSRNSSVMSFMGGRIRFCGAVNPALVVDLHLNNGRGLMCTLQAVAPRPAAVQVITSAQDAGPSDTEPAHTLLKAAGAWAVDKAPLIAARFPGYCC